MVKDELKEYQNEIDSETKELIKNYYQKKHLINKKDLACAIRLFTTLVLFLEEDKENKIHSNSNNVINYLNSSDLWSNDIYNNDDFNKNLSELKLIKVKINQIISLYEILGNRIDDPKEEEDEEDRSLSNSDED